MNLASLPEKKQLCVSFLCIVASKWDFREGHGFLSFRTSGQLLEYRRLKTVGEKKAPYMSQLTQRAGA